MRFLMNTLLAHPIPRLIHAFPAKPSLDTLGSRRCLRVPATDPRHLAKRSRGQKCPLRIASAAPLVYGECQQSERVRNLDFERLFGLIKRAQWFR